MSGSLKCTAISSGDDISISSDLVGPRRIPANSGVGFKTSELLEHAIPITVMAAIAYDVKYDRLATSVWVKFILGTPDPTPWTLLGLIRVMMDCQYLQHPIVTWSG